VPAGNFRTQSLCRAGGCCILTVCVLLWPAQVSDLTQQVAELQDVKEVNGATLASLQATLARIEAAEASASKGTRGGPACSPRATARSTGSAASSRRSSSAGNGGGGEAGGGEAPGGEASPSVALLSRELVTCKVAVADLERKLRVSARWVRHECWSVCPKPVPVR
jgi:hypothetical protein